MAVPEHPEPAPDHRAALLHAFATRLLDRARRSGWPDNRLEELAMICVWVSTEVLPPRPVEPEGSG